MKYLIINYNMPVRDPGYEYNIAEVYEIQQDGKVAPEFQERVDLLKKGDVIIGETSEEMLEKEIKIAYWTRYCFIKEGRDLEDPCLINVEHYKKK